MQTRGRLPNMIPRYNTGMETSNEARRGYDDENETKVHQSVPLRGYENVHTCSSGRPFVLRHSHRSEGRNRQRHWMRHTDEDY